MRLASSPEDLLQLARKQAEPDAGEAARVLARLGAALPSAREPIDAPLAPRAKAALPGTMRGTSLSTRRALLGSAGVALFAAGFWLGRVSAPPPGQTLRSPPREGIEASGVASAAQDAPAGLSSAPPRLERNGALSGDAGAGAPMSGADAAAVPPRSATPLGAARIAARGTRLRAVAPLASDEVLKGALRRLRRAQRALHDNDAGRALAALEDLDRRVPLDVLGEERQMTRILALCAAGETAEASSLARGWRTRYPGSVYATRLQGSCVTPPVPSPRAPR